MHMESAPVLGTVIAPTEDVTELGGPSGHEVCRWKLELPGGLILDCHKTAGHHTLKRDVLAEHTDRDIEVAWDRTGRTWMI